MKITDQHIIIIIVIRTCSPKKALHLQVGTYTYTPKIYSKKLAIEIII